MANVSDRERELELEIEVLELERQKALATTQPKPEVTATGVIAAQAQPPKSPKDLLPPLPTSMADIPGAKTAMQAGRIIRDNPKGAARALPAIAATGVSALAGPVALPFLAKAGAVGLAGAGGAYAKNMLTGDNTGPALVKDVAKEGAMALAGEMLPGAVAAAKPYAKEFGLGAIDLVGGLPQGTAKTAYENIKVLGKGVAGNFTRHVKNAAQSLSQLTKEASKRVSDEYGKIIGQEAGKTNKFIQAPKLQETLDTLASEVGIGGTNIKPGSDAVRTEVEKLLADYKADVARPTMKTVTERGPLGNTSIREVEEPMIRGHVDLQKALDLRKKIGEMADWAESGPGQGRQAAAMRNAYGKITNYIHEMRPNIAKVDAKYKKLVDATGYLRRKLGIKPGDEATPAAVEKMESLVRTINNPSQKETLLEAIDTMGKELGRKRSIVEHAAKVNASREMAPIFSRRKSVNVLGKFGKIAEAGLAPVTGPKAMSQVIKGTKAASKALDFPGKTQVAGGALRAAFSKRHKREDK